MPSAADIPLESRLFALFIGKYDSGKSTAAASFPGDKYFLDFDGRIVSLRGRKDVFFDTFASTHKGFGDADKAITTLQVKNKMNQLPYSTVCFDSISMGRRMLLYDSMKHTVGSGADKGGRKIGDLQLPTVQDYGYEAEAIWQLVYDGLKPLNCNIIVTGHTVDKYKKVQANPGAPVTSELDGEKIFGDPQLIAVLPILFTEIYYFSKEVTPYGQIKRWVEFVGDVARTTYPILAEKKRAEIPPTSEGGFYKLWSDLIKQGS